tara:strand:+ start:275 stop:616 length:342 start_codon:yes stop_codon:yes gene_type:complete
MNKVTKKMSLEQGKWMVSEGYINQSDLDEMIKNGKVANLREKESFRLRGVKEKVTVAFPTPAVTLPRKMKLGNLESNDLAIIEKYKKTLASKMRPIYEAVRDDFCLKVMVRQQ